MRAAPLVLAGMLLGTPAAQEQIIAQSAQNFQSRKSNYSLGINPHDYGFSHVVGEEDYLFENPRVIGKDKWIMHTQPYIRGAAIAQLEVGWITTEESLEEMTNKLYTPEAMQALNDTTTNRMGGKASVTPMRLSSGTVDSEPSLSGGINFGAKGDGEGVRMKMEFTHFRKGEKIYSITVVYNESVSVRKGVYPPVLESLLDQMRAGKQPAKAAYEKMVETISVR